MSLPKISIIIPAYNEEQGIANTLRAVCDLDYPNFEVIVVDNNSTDKTQEIAKKYPVKIVYEERKGLLYARECGRINASGDIIANLDADCLPEKDWLSKCALLFSDPKVVAVSGPYDYFDGSPFFRNFSLFIQKYIYSAMNKILSISKRGGILIGGNNMIRASVLDEIGGYNTDILFYGEDTDTAKRVSQKGKIIFNKSNTMKTSARRFKAEGTFKISVLYLFHFFKVIFSRNNR